MMPNPTLYQAGANAVLVLHLLVVAFIVGGLILVLLGRWQRWAWVRNRRFRLLHLAAIAYVVASAWLGIACPLTTLEQWLRARAGQAGHDQDFIAHWLGALLFFEAPPWVFAAIYSAFALLVVFGLVLVRPSPGGRPIR